MATDDTGHNLGDEIAGRAKEAWGRLTDNERLEAEGRAQHSADDVRPGHEQDPAGGWTGSSTPEEPASTGEFDSVDPMRDPSPTRAQPFADEPGGAGVGSGLFDSDDLGRLGDGDAALDPLDETRGTADDPLGYDPLLDEDPVGTDPLLDEDRVVADPLLDEDDPRDTGSGRFSNEP